MILTDHQPGRLCCGVFSRRSGAHFPAPPFALCEPRFRFHMRSNRKTNFSAIMKRLLLAVCVACLCSVSVLGNVPLGRVWERVDELGGQQANRICPVGTTAYAIGNGGAVWVSSDGQTWPQEATAAKEDLYGIIHHDGTLVAVGAGGRILRKPSGGNWGAQSSAVATALRAITWGGGQFVAVGDGGTVLRSVDGVNWSVWPSGFTEHLYDVIWDGAVFRAVGQKYTVASAAPGGTWVKHPQSPGYVEDYKSIAFSGNGYVINGKQYSTDGVVWLYSGSVVRNDVAWGGGAYVAVGNSGEILVSPDGVAWSSIQTSSNEALIPVEWTGSGFVAMTRHRRLRILKVGYPLDLPRFVFHLGQLQGRLLGWHAIRRGG